MHIAERIHTEDFESHGLTLEVSVEYREGYDFVRSGYYLTVTPVIKRELNGITTREYGSLTGAKRLVSDAFTDTEQGRTLALRLAENHKDELIAHVLQKYTWRS